MKKKFILFYPWLLKSPGERERERLGFGVPYFDTFFLKGNHYEKKVYTFLSLVT